MIMFKMEIPPPPIPEFMRCVGAKGLAQIARSNRLRTNREYFSTLVQIEQDAMSKCANPRISVEPGHEVRWIRSSPAHGNVLCDQRAPGPRTPHDEHRRMSKLIKMRPEPDR